MTIHYQDNGVTLYAGDCIAVMSALPAESVDAIVTDPPYGLEFMGREWDGADGFRRSLNPADVDRDNPFGRTSRTSPEYRAGHLFQEWSQRWAEECLRVLKPGGHLLAFGGTRTWHRLAVAVEDAGFEIRDSIAWMYGSGFPKSLDVSKAIDKAAGAEREIVGVDAEAVRRNPNGVGGNMRLNGCSTLAELEALAAAGAKTPTGRDAAATLANYHDTTTLHAVTAPATPDAARWQGWGTALKPAFEPIVVARKPLAGTVAANVLAHGTGALNIDACRIGDEVLPAMTAGQARIGTFERGEMVTPERKGRWPANVVLDDHQANALDQQSGETSSRSGGASGTTFGEVLAHGSGQQRTDPRGGHDDSGGASRFFYVAKADSSERVRVDGIAHPTVKPLDLMRWLVRLVTPPGGTVLEPFAGSGTTVEACILEGFRCIAIEREADYLPLIVQRINRRRDPVQAVKAAGEDGGLFDLLDNEESA